MTFAIALCVASLPFSLVGLYWCFLGRSEEATHRSHGAFAVANWLLFIGDVMREEALWAALAGPCAVLFTWLWWKNRRKGNGRKALKQLGEKSRARVAALVERMTPSPIPSHGGAS